MAIGFGHDAAHQVQSRLTGPSARGRLLVRCLFHPRMRLLTVTACAAGVAQWQEAAALKAAQCEFESRRRYVSENNISALGHDHGPLRICEILQDGPA